MPSVFQSPAIESENINGFVKIFYSTINRVTSNSMTKSNLIDRYNGLESEMKTKKVFLVISEKRERITMRRKTKKVIYKDFCRTCKKNVGWLTLDEVMTLTDETSAAIETNCENGTFDFRITEDGRFLICTDSIFRKMK